MSDADMGASAAAGVSQASEAASPSLTVETSDDVSGAVGFRRPAQTIITEDRGSRDTLYSPEDIATAMERALEGYEYIQFVSLRRRKLIFKIEPAALSAKSTLDWLQHILEVLDTANNVVVTQAMSPVLSDGIALAAD